MPKSLEQIQALNGARGTLATLRRFAYCMAGHQDAELMRTPDVPDSIYIRIDEDTTCGIHLDSVIVSLERLIAVAE